MQVLLRPDVAAVPHDHLIDLAVHDRVGTHDVRPGAGNQIGPQVVARSPAVDAVAVGRYDRQSALSPRRRPDEGVQACAFVRHRCGDRTREQAGTDVLHRAEVTGLASVDPEDAYLVAIPPLHQPLETVGEEGIAVANEDGATVDPPPQMTDRAGTAQESGGLVGDMHGRATQVCSDVVSPIVDVHRDVAGMRTHRIQGEIQQRNPIDGAQGLGPKVRQGAQPSAQPGGENDRAQLTATLRAGRHLSSVSTPPTAHPAEFDHGRHKRRTVATPVVELGGVGGACGRRTPSPPPIQHSVPMPARAQPDPATLPVLVRMADAQAAGLTKDQVRQRVRSGRWQPMSTGIYLREHVTSDDPFEDERLQHAHRARAAVMTHAESVIALSSAAAIHGLPLVSPLPEVVHLISATGRAGLRAGVNIHRLPLLARDVLDGEIPVTTPLRTWIDISRTSTLADSLALADAAVRRGYFTSGEAQLAATDLRGRGCRRVRAAAVLVDGRRESPLESWSAACFHAWGLPAPDPQAVILDRQGSFVARVDFLWKEQGVIGEADGALKYADPRTIYDEKLREDRLRTLGFRVIRWGWDDLRHPDDLRFRLFGALARLGR